MLRKLAFKYCAGGIHHELLNTLNVQPVFYAFLKIRVANALNATHKSHGIPLIYEKVSRYFPYVSRHHHECQRFPKIYLTFHVIPNNSIHQLQIHFDIIFQNNDSVFCVNPITILCNVNGINYYIVLVLPSQI